MTKTLFVDENEDIFEAFDRLGVEYTQKIVKHLRFISNKKSNNYIGYYQFKSENIYYKFYILPKTSPKTDNENLNKKNFINLLKIYYELKAKYKVIKSEEIFDNIIDFSFDDRKNQNNSDELDDFINYKYENALRVVEKFFKKHNHSIFKEINFNSQSVKNSLDIKRNITERDKSKIHQRKKVPFKYSKIALVSLECIEYFLQKELLKSVKSKAKKLNSKIKSRYYLKEDFSFKLKQITSKKITKLFKSNEQLELYYALLQLIGVENYFENNSSRELLKLHNQHSLFFRPEKLFEWIVYDYLNKEYKGYEILKDSFGEGTTSQYLLADTERDSNPDFILKKDDEVIVVDAKWKILKKKSDIGFDDVAKLRRDSLLNSATSALLIYPKVLFNLEKYTMNFDNFNFTIHENFI